MTSSATRLLRKVAVIGGELVGLMTAEVLAANGARVDVCDAMPSVGRKFLLTGNSGLKLTRSESRVTFLARSGNRVEALGPFLATFGADKLRAWAAVLGAEAFIGTSGRVFPVNK